MTMLTESEVRELSTSEYADLGKRLAKAYADLRQMKLDAKEAQKELKEGIELQESIVSRIAQTIRTGQKELPFAPVEKPTENKAQTAGTH